MNQINKDNLLELGTRRKPVNNFFYPIYPKEKHIHYNLEQSQFPLVLFGSNGSGRSISALSLVSQWVKNNEGFILVDNDRLSRAFTKLNNFKNKHNNNKDVYILNLSNEYTDESVTQEIKDLPKSSIDPLNPLIGNEEIFKLLFGESFGLLVHEIAKVVKANNELIDYQTIRSIMLFKNLQEWVKNNIWSEATKTIKEYLENNNEINHQQNCLNAFRYIELIEEYTKIGTFSTNPTLNLKDILIDQSILYCLLPMWHTETDNPFNPLNLPLDECDHLKVMDLILLQIHHLTQELNMDYPNKDFWQNIAILEFEYSCSNKVYNYVFNNLSRKNKWILSGYVPDNYNSFERRNKKTIINNASTIVLMQSNTYSSEISDELKLKIFNSVQNLTNIFYDKSTVLADQREGTGYAFIKVDGKYELTKITLFYEAFRE